VPTLDRMADAVAAVAGMTISIRTRRDVVIVDPDRFLVAARKALRDVNPSLTEVQAVNELVDVTDAVYALLDRDGQLAADQLGAAMSDLEVGAGAPGPGSLVVDRSDGLSPAGRLQQVVLNEPQSLQDYGCFLPDDPFALPPAG
jgi:hypothetical protein